MTSKQHGDHEQIHIREESGESLLPVHIPDGIDMDQESDAGDHEQHDAGERIDQKGKIDRRGRRRKSTEYAMTSRGSPFRRMSEERSQARRGNDKPTEPQARRWATSCE